MKQLALLLIRLYQYIRSFTSPYKTCVFEPTCSSYAKEAIERYGFMKGTFLAMKRVGRCHPWQKNKGWDPVPKK